MRGRRLGLKTVTGMAVALGLAGGALGDVTTERSGSILVFPKVIANGVRDTIIQITNTSNSLVRAHCFYVNAQVADPTQPFDPVTNPRVWVETDFDIVLTKQQPTHWLVSEGRPLNPLDASCAPGNQDCSGAGFDPGLIPPVVPTFEGELKCIEVDDSGAPLAGNHLKGEATVVAGSFVVTGLAPETDNPVVLLPGEVSKYNALAVAGSDNNGDAILVLGGGQCLGDGPARGAVCTSDEACGDAAPCMPEYNGCPATWIFNHTADRAPNLVLEDEAIAGHSFIDTELTVVPCTQNFETQETGPARVTLQFRTFNEFENVFSVSTTVECWGNFRLSDLSAPALTFAGTTLPDPQGTMYLQSRIRSADGTPRGAMMVAEEFHAAERTLIVIPGPTADIEVHLAAPAAFNLHVEGEGAAPDIITVPAEQLLP